MTRSLCLVSQSRGSKLKFCLSKVLNYKSSTIIVNLLLCLLFGLFQFELKISIYSFNSFLLFLGIKDAALFPMNDGFLQLLILFLKNVNCFLFAEKLIVHY